MWYGYIHVYIYICIHYRKLNYWIFSKWKITNNLALRVCRNTATNPPLLPYHPRLLHPMFWWAIIYMTRCCYRYIHEYAYVYSPMNIYSHFYYQGIKIVAVRSYVLANTQNITHATNTPFSTHPPLIKITDPTKSSPIINSRQLRKLSPQCPLITY